VFLAFFCPKPPSNQKVAYLRHLATGQLYRMAIFILAGGLGKAVGGHSATFGGAKLPEGHLPRQSDQLIVS